jgi:hypothetical protein
MKLVVALCVAALAMAIAPALAAATSTEAEVHDSIAKAVGYIEAQQEPDGAIVGFGGDWSATGLAAAGVDASQVRTAPDAPSFQDALQAEYAKPEWTEAEPSSATDYERATLVSYAAGIDPARVTAESNLPAQIAGTWNYATGSFGPPSTNGTAFGILALRRTPVPTWALQPSVEYLRLTQHDDGGWDYSASTTPESKEGPSEQDMTGSVVAALCEAGVPTYDPTVSAALAYLHSQQIAATGGFEYVYGEPSADVAAWIVSGLNACGIDPQSPEWTTSAGKTPIDFLLTQQESDGSFTYAGAGNLYTTQGSLRAISGGVFTAAPRTHRATPDVAAGTPVPHALAIKLGPGNVQMCKVTAPAGAPLTTVLEAAEGPAAFPKGCIRSLGTVDGRVASIDGVEPSGSDEAWLARLDRGAAAAAAGQAVGFGDVVSLWLGATPAEGGSGTTTGPAGPKGETGSAGPQGKEGKEGKPGKQGKQGRRGKRGPKGTHGSQGKGGKHRKDRRAKHRAHHQKKHRAKH